MYSLPGTTYMGLIVFTVKEMVHIVVIGHIRGGLLLPRDVTA